MSCESFVQECGISGNCTFDDLTNSSACVCTGRWTNQIEYSFLEDSTVLGPLQPCTYNETFIYTLHVIGGIFSVLGMIQQVATRKVGKAFVSTATFISLFLGSLLMWLRVLNPDTALFGEDAFYSFLVGNFYCVVVGVVQMFLVRYMKYLSLKLQQGASRVFTVEFSIRIVRVLIVFDVIMFQLYGLCAVVDKEKANVVFTLAVTYTFSKAIVLYYTTDRFLGEHISNMKLLLSDIVAKTKNSSEFSSRETDRIRLTPRLQVWIKIHYPKAKLRSHSVKGFCVLMFVHTGVVLVWRPWTYTWSYLQPILIIIYSCLTFHSTFVSLRAHKHVKNVALVQPQPVSTRLRGYSFENTEGNDPSIGRSLTLKKGKRRSYHPKAVMEDLLNIPWSRFEEESKLDSDDELV
mmetsp:Transcript_11651/g.13507  ORF Transcript_11651/g.13507 Transcript_11651/m.13507 type:complete len:405 (+) Transcript_11651:218-1432(+)